MEPILIVEDDKIAAGYYGGIGIYNPGIEMRLPLLRTGNFCTSGLLRGGSVVKVTGTCGC